MNEDSSKNDVEYDGHCAFAVSLGKTDVHGGKAQSTIGGKTYSFSNPIAKFLFSLLPKRIEKADKIWEHK